MLRKEKGMTVSFETDIKPLFRRGDVRCMGRREVLLDDYDYMSDATGNETYADHANARAVYCFLIPDGCTPRMPKGGPFWDAQQLGMFKTWMDGGFQN